MLNKFTIVFARAEVADQKNGGAVYLVLMPSKDNMQIYKLSIKLRQEILCL